MDGVEEGDLKKGSETKTSPCYSVGQQHFEKEARGLDRTEGLVISGGSDLVPSKLLYPSTHSLARFRFEIENDVNILIEVKDGKIFFGIDNDRVLP